MVPRPWASVWCQDVRSGCWHVGSGMYLGRVAPSGKQNTHLEIFIQVLACCYFCIPAKVSLCLLCCRYRSSLETQISTSWLRSLRLLARLQRSRGLLVSVFTIDGCVIILACESLCNLFVIYVLRAWLVYQTMCPSKYFLAHLWNIYSVQLEMTY